MAIGMTWRSAFWQSVVGSVDIRLDGGLDQMAVKFDESKH
jgi:hypothetical protein